MYACIQHTLVWLYDRVTSMGYASMFLWCTTSPATTRSKCQSVSCCLMNIYKFKLVMSENNFQPVIRPCSQLTKPYPEGKDSNSFLSSNRRSENWASPQSSATLPSAFSTKHKWQARDQIWRRQYNSKNHE